MDINSVLNSAPVGVLLGIIVTKTFDILNKKVEYRQEAKKILYTKKLDVAEKSIQYLNAYYEELYAISLTISQSIENETMNPKLFTEMWEVSHGNIKKLGGTSLEMFNKVFLYFNIDRDKFHIKESNEELFRNISNVLNLAESEDKTNRREVLTNYNKSLQQIMNNYKDLMNLIIVESKVI